MIANALQKFITEVIKAHFEVTDETAFRYHDAADEYDVEVFNESEGKDGLGPDPQKLAFDFTPGSTSTHWNYACAVILLNDTTVKYPNPRLDRESYIEMVFDKLKRLKHYYNQGQPRLVNGVLENDEDILRRTKCTDKTRWKRARANKRRLTVSP